MTQEFDIKYVERVLSTLDEKGFLFPQFELTKVNNELKLLGTGGFSAVYEMHNKERKDLSFALKVSGIRRHCVNSEEFWNTGRIQWILCQESPYVLRILDVREVMLTLDTNGNVTDVKDTKKEICEETENSIRLQLVLMEKLDELIEKDRFYNVKLRDSRLSCENQVLKLAFEIGQALAIAHTNNCLHRDVKLENIFWDSKDEVYKLGDFGIAKWAEDGNAETIVYTNGYGAPEIEKRIYDKYNATADIYSLGITLYLLLNELRFPGSDGYYSKVEVQYNSDFVFPAPVNASEEMARVIRKMCAFYPQDRYQTMSEVLAALTNVLDVQEGVISEELFELADIATETFHEDKDSKAESDQPEKREKTRFELKEEQKAIDGLYREESCYYCLAITILLTLLFKGLQHDSGVISNGVFFVAPVAVLLEALFQRMKELDFVFGGIIIAFIAFFINMYGFNLPYATLGICVLAGSPVISLAAGVATILWGIIEHTNKMTFLGYISDKDLGWIVLVILLIVAFRYFYMSIELRKISYIRAYTIMFIFDKLFLAMIIAGGVLLGLKRAGVMIPVIVDRLHLIRTGIVALIIYCVFVYLNGILDEEADIQEGDDIAEND